MHEIIDLSNFDKSKIKISIPSQNKDGQFSKLTYNNLPIIIQSPVSLTKQGVLKNGKKMVCDLMFKSIETDLLNWVEQLESVVHGLLYEKSDDWFEQKLELLDIENLFTTPIKLFKSGKYYLIRATLKDPIKIFKENDNFLELTYSDITHESNIVSLIEIKGIKYTSKDFQFDIEIKQIMIVSPDPFLENCFIKIKKTEMKDIEDDDVGLGSRVNTFDIDNMVNTLIEKQSIDIDINDIQFEKHENEPQIKELNLEDLVVEEEPIKLTNEEDYMKIYVKAKQEANEAKNSAIAAYMKLEEIRLKYNIDESDEENI
jgi:hypothetical protein